MMKQGCAVAVSAVLGLVAAGAPAMRGQMAVSPAVAMNARVEAAMMVLGGPSPAVFLASSEDGSAKPKRTVISNGDGVLTIDEDGPQVKDDLFDGTEKFGAKAKESNEVNLDKNMLGLAAGKGGSKADLAKKMDFIVVRNYEYAKEGDYNMAAVQQYFKKLDAAGWKHMVRTRSAKESTDICVKQDAEGVTREMVIINAEPLELSFIHLKGNVSLNDLNKLNGMMGTHGGDDADDPKLQKR